MPINMDISWSGSSGLLCLFCQLFNSHGKRRVYYLCGCVLPLIGLPLPLPLIAPVPACVHPVLPGCRQGGPHQVHTLQGVPRPQQGSRTGGVYICCRLGPTGKHLFIRVTGYMFDVKR